MVEAHLLAVDVSIVQAGEAGLVVRVHDKLTFMGHAVAAVLAPPQKLLQHPWPVL